jgi:hypothetical protein
VKEKSKQRRKETQGIYEGEKRERETDRAEGMKQRQRWRGNKKQK